MLSSNYSLDIFGQNPRLSRLYTQLCFCFPLPNHLSRIQDTITYLQRGLTVLTSSFPWVAGQVILADNGISTIVPFEKTPNLYVHNKVDELPAFEGYREGGFPFIWLEERDVASHSTLPGQLDEPAPVLALQATFVSGGLLLTFSAQHNCMDMAGQCQMIRLFAKACHDSTNFTEEELKIGNLAREHIVPLLQDLPDEISAERSLPKAIEPEAEGEATWAYFLFTPTRLSTIKSLAQQDLHVEFVSTDDALSAFLWKHITYHRLSQRTPASTLSTFERQVDVRKHLGLPAMYTGNAVYKTSTSLPVEDVVSKSLGYLASELRASLNPTPGLGYRAQQDATRLHRQLGVNQNGKGTATRGGIPRMDMKMSSWAKEDCCNFDFGELLGKPEAVRRPSFEGWDGLSYLMPKGQKGEIAAALCLIHEDILSLKDSEEFAQFAQYIG